jgi:hypothetical protein
MQVHIVQAMVNLYFCWCIILPHNEIRTLFIPALGYMYLCWALLIHAICVVFQGCVFCQILSPYSYASWARAAPSRIPFQHCKMCGGMLKIGLQPSRSTESRLKILGYTFAPVVTIPFSIPLLHHNVPQQKLLTELLDSSFSRLFTWIQTVIDVEGVMAPYMWYLVERPGGAFNFFPSHKSSHRCH